MAIAPDAEEVERQRLRPFADELFAIIRQADPDATYSFGPGPDDGIWLLNVYLHEPLDEDFDLHAAVSERAVDFLIQDGVHIAVVPLPRTTAAARTAYVGA
jgi:hypothetical protein